MKDILLALQELQWYIWSDNKKDFCLHLYIKVLSCFLKALEFSFKRGEFWFILNCNILNFRKENVPVSPGGEFTYTQLPQLTWINMIQGQHSQAWTCQVPQPTCFWTRPDMDKTDVNLFEDIACIPDYYFTRNCWNSKSSRYKKGYLKANTTPKNNNDSWLYYMS